MGLFDVFIVIALVGVFLAIDGVLTKRWNARTQATSEQIWYLWRAGRLTGEEAGKLLSSLRGDG